MKIALIVPSTSHKREWKRIQDSFLFHSIHSFVNTKSPEYEYRFFIGHDHDDPFYTEMTKTQFADEFSPLEIQFLPLTVEKGHVTKMWNELARVACEWGAEYLYQCGDDILFANLGWIRASVEALQAHGNVGLTGPRNVNGNTQILTQCFVHRSHVDIFGGCFFPEEILNWYCDDWINGIYGVLNRVYPIPANLLCANIGGAERYDVVVCPELCRSLIIRDFPKIINYVRSRNG
ncbi:MAG: hypothetical protein ABL921_17500 [Pirellula sp.]